MPPEPQDDLFGPLVEQELATNRPLAARMRPATLDDVVGHENVLGPDSPLRTAIAGDRVPSLILHGPPGCGKTTLARVVAASTNAAFEELSAVSAGLADARAVIARARDRLTSGQRTVLFLDEIHRFNKAQQDALLPAVEDGLITLIGATTENPYYEVNSALISRMHVITLSPLDSSAIATMLDRAVHAPQGLADRVTLDPEARDALVERSGGDGRHALKLLEAAAAGLPDGATITTQVVQDADGRRTVVYDKTGDAHYDTISAFIKSMRASDADATVYYLAVMLHGGEDPKFIARRILIAAAEDVGNADPRALGLAGAAARAVEFVGMPEARIPLAQAAIFVALAPKSNASYKAINAALEHVEKHGAQRPPKALRDSSRLNAKHFGHGEGYHYPHDFPDAVLAESLLPEGMEHAHFYTPTDRGAEAQLDARLRQLRERRR
ncbi:MAG TPA: replication-associated recombination protein A [Miltoncostaeales bacterium]|nr:replication-associated recombination protein A [Miltoncostaeales bacterium]